MGNKAALILIIFLSLSALILGFLIFQRLNSQNSTVLPNDQFQTDNQTLQTTNAPKDIFTIPPGDASEKEIKEYRAYLDSQAKASPALDITNCHPEPIVLKTKIGSSITLVNKSSKNHKIVVNQKDIYTVNANGSSKITPVFEHGSGAYAYTCDSSTKAVGILYSVN